MKCIDAVSAGASGFWQRLYDLHLAATLRTSRLLFIIVIVAAGRGGAFWFGRRRVGLLRCGRDLVLRRTVGRQLWPAEGAERKVQLP